MKRRKLVVEKDVWASHAIVCSMVFFAMSCFQEDSQSRKTSHLEAASDGRHASSSDDGIGEKPIELDTGDCSRNPQTLPSAAYIQANMAACNSGNSKCCLYVSSLYRGIEFEELRSMKEENVYLQKACDLVGDQKRYSGEGCVQLGDNLQQRGKTGEARSLYMSACNKGWAMACVRLHHEERMAGASRLKQAEQFQKMACELGHQPSCDEIKKGMFYACGGTLGYECKFIPWSKFLQHVEDLETMKKFRESGVPSVQ